MLLISGCVYAPHATDIPLISKKKDLRIDGGISIAPSIHGTVSYGLTDKIALQGFGSFTDNERYYYQAAAGLFKNRENNEVMEVYGGLGYGYGDASKHDNPGNLYGDYQLYFAQLNYGKIASESSNFEVGIGLKTGYLHSNLTDRNYYDRTSTEPYDVYNDDSILFEPTGMIRVGGEHLRFSLKLGGTLIHKFTNTDKYLPYGKVNMGLGLNLRL